MFALIRAVVSALLACAALLPLIALAFVARAALDQPSLLMAWFNHAAASPFLLVGPLVVIIAFMILSAIAGPARRSLLQALEAALILISLGWAGSRPIEFSSATKFVAWLIACWASIYLNSRRLDQWAPKNAPSFLRSALFWLTPIWGLCLPRPIWSAIGARHGDAGRRVGDALGALLALVLVPGLVLPMALSLLGRVRPEAGVKRIAPGSFYDVEVDPLNGRLFATSPETGRLLRYDLKDPGSSSSTLVPATEIQDLLLLPGQGKIYHFGRLEQRGSRLGAASALLIIDADDIDKQLTVAGDWPACMGSVYLGLDQPRGLLFVSCENSGPFVWDLGENRLVAQIGLGAQTSHMVVWPGKAMYISLGKMQRVLRVPYGEWRVETSAEIDSYPNRMLVVPERNELLVSLPLRGQILVLDPDTLAERRRIETVLGARAMAYDPKSGYLFVASVLNWQVAVVDLDSGLEARRLRVGRWLRQVAIDPASRTAFVTSRYDGLLSFKY